MPKHESTPPPPAASKGLDLGDLINNISLSNNTRKQATTSFPATAQQSTRIKTEHAPLGDPGRTVLEGVAPPTAFQTVVDPTVVPGTGLRGMVPPSQGAGYPAHTPSMILAAPSIKSAAPNWARSVLTKPEDQKMASRQTAFATLSPAEQAKQNTWAQSIIGRSIQCPQGFDWERHHNNTGYQCAGKHHFVSDDLLAEGKGGVMLVPAGGRGDMERWWGPYYPDPKKPERLVYGGSGNHSINSSFGPDWTEPKTETWHWPKLWQIFKGLKGPPGNEADYPLLEHNLALFFLMPVGIRSSSHGATLVLRGDPADDPFGGWQNRGAGWGPGSGAGSGISYAGLLRSPSQIHTDDLGSHHISRGSSKKKTSSKKSKGLGAALSRFSSQYSQ